MTGPGHNSGDDDASVAGGELRQFVERIERLEEENKAINDDKSDVYGEAKGRGYDVKILKRIIRDRRRDPQQRMEEESIYELYKAALGME